MREVTEFFYRLKGYLAEPRDNGPELLVSIGLLLVFACLLIILVSWVRFRVMRRKHGGTDRAGRGAESLPADDLRTQEAAPVSEVPESVLEPPRPWPWMLTGVIAFLLLAALVSANAVPRYTMGRTGYCDSCHTMKKAVGSWRASKHSKVPCQACHERPGVTGIALSQLQGLSNISLSSFYWGRHRPLVLKSPVSPACISCHQEIRKSVIKFRDTIIVSHKEFIDITPCEVCHPDSGHRGKKPRIDLMEKCVACHAENRAAVSCSTCHLREPSWTKSRLVKYRKTPTSFASCLTCHPTEMRCPECHKGERLTGNE